MSETLTGRQRFRSERPLWKAERLVLQLEVEYSGMDLVGGWPERVRYNFWRDARVTDLPNPHHLTHN